MRKVNEERIKTATEYLSSLITFEDAFKRYGIDRQLHPTSEGFAIECVFHSDYDPSFKVNTTYNFYKCFACHDKKGGNVITFMSKYETDVIGRKITYGEMVDRLINEEPKHKLVLGFNSVFEQEIEKSSLFKDFKINKFKRVEDKKPTLIDLYNLLIKENDKEKIITAIDLLQKNLNLEYVYNKVSQPSIEISKVEVDENTLNMFRELGDLLDD